MATEIKSRRGTAAQHDDSTGFTGAEGELTVDTTNDTVRVHDGSTKGGHRLAKYSEVQASNELSEMGDVTLTSTAAGHILIHDGSDSFDNKAVSGAITINSSGVTALASGQALTNLGGGSGTTFLRKDGTFATPTNTTYSIQDGELSQNNFTDADHSKLNAIEASADVTDTTNVVAALTAGTNIAIAGDGTISSTATSTTYSIQDGELSQNNFTNDDHTKLNGIEASADVTDTTNVVAALTAGTNIAIAGNGTISATDTNTTYSVQDGELSQNNFTDDDHTKLNGIEASADVTDTTNVVAALTAGTNIAIAGDGTISSTDTNTTFLGGTGLTLDGTTFNVDAAQTQITSLGTLTGLTTGATTVNGLLTVNNDTLQLTSTTASSGTENPALELYRNGGSGSGQLGAIKFFGNNDAGTPEKFEYAGIYADVQVAADGNEQGCLKFSLGTGGAQEDPAMALFSYGLQMGYGNPILMSYSNGYQQFFSPNAAQKSFKVNATPNATVANGAYDIYLPDVAGGTLVAANSDKALTAGATTVNGPLIATNDYHQFRSTNTNEDKMPLIEVFRDKEITGNGSDPLGGFVFTGRNEDDRKVSYGSFYCASSNQSDDGEHKGSLIFTVADGSGAVDPFTDYTDDSFDTGHSVALNITSDAFSTSGYLQSNTGELKLGSKQSIKESADDYNDQSLYDLHMPNSAKAKVISIGGIGPYDAYVTGNQSVAQMLRYRGQNIIIVSSGALEFELPACAASTDISNSTANIGDIFQISNAAGGALTIDRDGSGTAQTVYYFPSLTLTAFTNNPTLAVGGTIMLQAVAANTWMVFNDSGLSDA